MAFKTHSSNPLVLRKGKEDASTSPYFRETSREATLPLPHSAWKSRSHSPGGSAPHPPAQPAICRFIIFSLFSSPVPPALGVTGSCSINKHRLKKCFCSPPEQARGFLEINAKLPRDANQQEDGEGDDPIPGSGATWPEQQEKHPVPQVLYPPEIYGRKNEKNPSHVGANLKAGSALSRGWTR